MKIRQFEDKPMTIPSMIHALSMFKSRTFDRRSYDRVSKKMAICEKGKQTEFSQGHLVYSINDKHGHNP